MSSLRQLILSWFLALTSLVSGVAAATASELPDLDPLRFATEIMAFQDWEAKNTLPEGGILFVGSSSIRMWPTAMAFPNKVIINRGFGGAEFPDLFYYYERVITRYAPAKILLYVGDNDVSRGKSADAVFADYLKLVDGIQRDLPDTELHFISVKPSPARWHHWPVMLDINRRVAAHAADDPQLGYVDLASSLLVDGEPGPFYIFDGIHLNEAGYEGWRQVLAPIIADW
jgi:lysophospholipase L1-like esterase